MKALLIIEILLFFTKTILKNYVSNDLQEIIKAHLGTSKPANMYIILNLVFYILLIIILIKAVLLMF